MDKPIHLAVIDDGGETHEVVDLLFGPGQVVHAYNGRDGLDVIAAHPELDALILDLTMPVMDGFAVLERLKSDTRFRSIPVCVFTSNREQATQALGLGARDFVDKRSDYQELKLRILNLVEAKRKAEVANHAKADFLSVISHELRTPMNGILGMAQAIRDGALSAEQSRYLEILEQSSHKMMAMVDDVLQFLESENPLQPLPRTPFDPRQVVQSVVTRLGDAAFHNEVSIDPVWGPGVPTTLIGLPEKLAVVLHHLVGNAVKFSPGGKVLVSVDSVESPTGTVCLRFAIRDTGVGFPDGWRDRILNPFTQVDGSVTRKFGGLGIGLSIASRVVQMLGGTLEVESEPGRGSQFTFVLTFTAP